MRPTTSLPFALTPRGAPLAGFGETASGRFRLNLGTDLDEPHDTAQEVTFDDAGRLVVVGSRRVGIGRWRAYALRSTPVP